MLRSGTVKGKEIEVAEDQTIRLCTDSFQHLPEQVKGDFDESRDTLRQCFQPKSCQGQYQVELQTHKKKRVEGWADLSDDLGRRADKADTELQQGRG